MTVPVTKELRCAICGKVSTQFFLASTSMFEPPDLDTRPGEPMRSSMDLWIQTCPYCGYCAPDISEKILGAEQIVKSKQYQEIIKNTDSPLPDLSMPKLENAFVCYSLIQENAGDFVEAGWARVHAAWVCDDKKLSEEARKHRLKAVEFFKKVRDKGLKFAEDEGSEYAILTDLLRRAGKFELALETLREGLNKNPSEIIAKILKFEEMLINKGDTNSHNMKEIPEI